MCDLAVGPGIFLFCGDQGQDPSRGEANGKGAEQQQGHGHLNLGHQELDGDRLEILEDNNGEQHEDDSCGDEFDFLGIHGAVIFKN